MQKKNLQKTNKGKYTLTIQNKPMRKTVTYISIMFLAAMMLASCKPDPVTDGPVGPTPPEHSDAISVSAVLDRTNAKSVWSEGDEFLLIAIADNIDNEFKFILTEGAETKTAKFVPAEGQKAIPENATAYYAVFPYTSDVNFVMHKTFSFRLETERSSTIPLFAYSTSLENLTFNSILGSISFTLKGNANIKSVFIEDNDKSSILNGNVEFEPAKNTTLFKNASASKNTVSYTFPQPLNLKDTGEQSDNIIIEVPVLSFAEGGVMTLYDKNDQPCATVDIPSSIITGGVTTELGHFEFKATESVRELSATETANSYIVPDSGTYKFKAVMGNDNSKTLDDAAVAILLWETWCDSLEVTPNSVISSVSLEDGYVVFSTPEQLHAGNALVAVKDASGEILWSWHIWVPESDITTDTYGLFSAPVMDRYVGALKAAKVGERVEGTTLGMQYQWGRKDPFVSVADISNTSKATIAGTERTKAGDASETAEAWTVDQTVKNPTVFVARKGDWCAEPDNNLWSSVKTLYDPCPPGYRITATEDSDIFSSSMTKETLTGWSVDFEKGYFTAGDPVTVLPISGYLNYSGSYDKPGLRVKIYHAPATSEYAPALYVYQDGDAVYKPNSGQRRAVAGPVRCISTTTE